MSTDSKSRKPSSIYVFVVLATAAFLTLFVFFRRPGITYETQVTFRTDATSAVTQAQDAKSKLLAPEFVLDAMRQANFLKGETNPESLGIAKSIADRMRVATSKHDAGTYTHVMLVTKRPKAGIKLLDGMMHVMVDKAGDDAAKFVTHPAVISRQHGGSVSPFDLILLLIASAVMGVVGLVLADRIDESDILHTPEEVDRVAGIPVLGNFADVTDDADLSQLAVRRRAFRFALRAAELSVAAVFVLMIYNLVTQHALLTRFMHDPLAAYGEVLTHVIG